MLEIKDLKISRNKKLIIKGITLKINKGEVHVLMGPNGSGKSTLANALAGSFDTKIKSGSVFIDKKDLLKMDIDKRALNGLFMAFQYPVEVPGVSLLQFLRLAYEAKFGVRITPGKFLKLVNTKAALLNMNKGLINRYLNEGFSGGEKKKVEILQMAILSPSYAILDETDSGLDVNALKLVAEGVNKLIKELNMGVLIITHYSRVLKFLKPDFVHVLLDGKIVKSGGMEVAEEIEEHGYDSI